MLKSELDDMRGIVEQQRNHREARKGRQDIFFYEAPDAAGKAAIEIVFPGAVWVRKHRFPQFDPVATRVSNLDIMVAIEFYKKVDAGDSWNKFEDVTGFNDVVQKIDTANPSADKEDNSIDDTMLVSLQSVNLEKASDLNGKIVALHLSSYC